MTISPRHDLSPWNMKRISTDTVRSYAHVAYFNLRSNRDLLDHTAIGCATILFPCLLGIQSAKAERRAEHGTLLRDRPFAGTRAGVYIERPRRASCTDAVLPADLTPTRLACCQQRSRVSFGKEAPQR